MKPFPPPLAFFLLMFSVWVNRQQQEVIDYLVVCENSAEPQNG